MTHMKKEMLIEKIQILENLFSSLSERLRDYKVSQQNQENLFEFISYLSKLSDELDYASDYLTSFKRQGVLNLSKSIDSYLNRLRRFMSELDFDQSTPKSFIDESDEFIYQCNYLQKTV